METPVKWEETQITVELNVLETDISQEDMDSLVNYLRARMEEELRRFLDRYFYEHIYEHNIYDET